jgi:hypothetical protein
MHFDSIDLTAPSEYGSRDGQRVDVLQIHHATTTSLSGLRGLMAPGGRKVSANGAMGKDGHLMLVVPADRRAFTSATSYDKRSFTVEVCNTTLDPHWGISDACHERLAQLASEMHHELGMPLDRAHIIGHREVPGTYPTACPGPSMDLDRIVRRAREIAEGDDMPSAKEIVDELLNRPLPNPANNDLPTKVGDLIRYGEWATVVRRDEIMARLAQIVEWWDAKLTTLGVERDSDTQALLDSLKAIAPGDTTVLADLTPVLAALDQLKAGLPEATRQAFAESLSAPPTTPAA